MAFDKAAYNREYYQKHKDYWQQYYGVGSAGSATGRTGNTVNAVKRVAARANGTFQGHNPNFYDRVTGAIPKKKSGGNSLSRRLARGTKNVARATAAASSKAAKVLSKYGLNIAKSGKRYTAKAGTVLGRAAKSAYNEAGKLYGKHIGKGLTPAQLLKKKARDAYNAAGQKWHKKYGHGKNPVQLAKSKIKKEWELRAGKGVTPKQQIKKQLKTAYKNAQRSWASKHDVTPQRYAINQTKKGIKKGTKAALKYSGKAVAATARAGMKGLNSARKKASKAASSVMSKYFGSGKKKTAAKNKATVK